MTNPKVCIIILNWNGLVDTIECLESLKKITYPNYKVIVVDNASSGDDVEVLTQKYGGYIHIIQNDKNYGFAEGNNIGIKYALAHLAPNYVFLLNNDTVVAPDMLDELIKVTEGNKRIGIACPLTYWYDQPEAAWYDGGMKIDLYRGICTERRKKNYDQPVIESEFATGAAMLVKRGTLESAGLLPEYHYFGVEDIDYSLNALRHGFAIVCATRAKVWHKGSRYVSATRIGYHYRGWQIMRRKYLSTPGYIIATICSLIWGIFRAIMPFFRYLYHGNFKEIRNFGKKTVEALKGTLCGTTWKSNDR